MIVINEQFSPLIKKIKQYLSEREKLEEKVNSLPMKYGIANGLLLSPLMIFGEKYLKTIVNLNVLGPVFILLLIIVSVIPVTNIMRKKRKKLLDEHINSQLYQDLKKTLLNEEQQKEIISYFMSVSKQNTSLKKLTYELIEKFKERDTDLIIETTYKLIKKIRHINKTEELEKKEKSELDKKLEAQEEYLKNIGVEESFNIEEKEINGSIKMIKTKL